MLSAPRGNICRTSGLPLRPPARTIPMGKEVELKFEVPPGGARHLAGLPALRRNGGPAQEKNLVSVYFDTPKRKLQKHGLSLRVRHIGDKRVQTIKANGDAAAGLFSRGEWEKAITSDTPDLRAARHSPLGSLLTRKLKRALAPVFETRVHRTVLPFDDGGSRIEVTLDRGQVRRGRQWAPINEVELELKRAGFSSIVQCELGESEHEALRGLDFRVAEGGAQIVVEATR